MIGKANFTEDCGIYFEHSVEFHGKGYLLVYGYDTSGDFVFFPLLKRGCYLFNDFKPIPQLLMETGLKEEFSNEVAAYIEQWQASHPEQMREVEIKKIENSCRKNEKIFKTTL